MTPKPFECPCGNPVTIPKIKIEKGTLTGDFRAQIEQVCVCGRVHSRRVVGAIKDGVVVVVRK